MERFTGRHGGTEIFQNVFSVPPCLCGELLSHDFLNGIHVFGLLFRFDGHEKIRVAFGRLGHALSRRNLQILAERAKPFNGTLAAFRAAVAIGAAGESSVRDEIDVQIELAFVGHQIVQNAMRFIGICFGPNPAQPFANAKDVRVNGKRRFIEEKHQNARDGFRPDAVKFRQIRFTFARG